MDIRPASISDIRGIYELVKLHAELGDVLPRTQTQIAESLSDWIVGSLNDEIVACVSLLSYNKNLAEVRSLIVSAQIQGMGWGATLLEAIIEEAKKRKIPKIFALTRVETFFKRAGFSLSDRSHFPEKIWRDCDQCPVKDNCDEIAVELQLEKTSNLYQTPEQSDTFVLHQK
ncbi:MAG: GNAT family N-acetyltransferase [Chloroflexi bacterium]|nr:GNAT family N-acetyltransferase [Chloroflexota bacterium]